MTKLSANRAAKEAGIAKKTLLEAIASGRLTATKNDKGHWEIEPVELFRAYPKTGFLEPEKPQPTLQENHEKASGNGALEIEVKMLREQIDVLTSERDRERGQLVDQIEDLRGRLNAALWTAKTVAEGGTGDLFYTMNKEAAGDDLGLTLQTGFVTKALVGLFGSDRFRLAVSADGSTFFDGLSVDNATGIVDQLRLPRFKAWTNYDNYVGVGTWTKIGLNNTDTNDQGAFDAANNHFVAPVDGTYLFGATLLYKINASATARMRGRLVLNGTTEIRGSLGEISATHVSLATAIWLQTLVPLTAGDTVELQGYFRVADGYFAADHTSFWGCKIG